MDNSEKVNKIKSIFDALEMTECIYCGNEITYMKFEGHGEYQPYCICDRWHPNSDENVISEIKKIIDDDRR